MIRCTSIIVLWLIILIVLLTGITRAEDKGEGYGYNSKDFATTNGCPQIESDYLQCPEDKDYQSSRFPGYIPPKMPVYKYREDYSESDKRRLFRGIKKSKSTSTEDLNKMLYFLKGK